MDDATNPYCINLQLGTGNIVNLYNTLLNTSHVYYVADQRLCFQLTLSDGVNHRMFDVSTKRNLIVNTPL